MRRNMHQRRQRKQARRPRPPRARAARAQTATPATLPDADVRRDATQAVWHILSSGHSAANALKLGEHAMRTTSHLVAQSPYHEQLACCAGCSWCCYIPVAVTPPEALAIAQYLREHASGQALTALRNRLADHARRIARLSSSGHAEARIPCALLRDGQCSVYDVRPIRCRRWNSIDRMACEVGFHDAHAAVVPVDPYAYAAGGSVQIGLQEGSTQHGLDGTWYEFHSAVWCALEVDDAAVRWVRGEAVFADCTPIERSAERPT